MTTSSPHRLLRSALLVLLLPSLAATVVVGVTAGSPAVAAGAYDTAVLADHPVAYWGTTDVATDVTGHGHTGTALGASATSTSLLPDGESARTFDGVGQYVSVPSSAAFSIPTTKQLTWEAWIRPAVLQFPHSTGGYIDFLGKCANYSPTCEWEARMYDLTNSQNRPSRLSAYAFNPSAGLGSAADWQPSSGVITAGTWLHVVGEYQTVTTPSACNAAYPGTLDIWVDGVKQSFASHAPTGCMSQYSVIPRANTSPFTIGTMARDSWFQGAIGKVAIYDGLLTQAQISAHFTAMTGLAPSGSCANTCSLSVQAGSGASAPAPTASATPTTTATPTASPSATATFQSPAPSSTSAAPSTSTPAPSTSSPAPSTSSPAPSTGAVSATVKVTSSWSTGYCASVVISTTGPDLSAWTATTTVSGRVTSLWDASWTQSGSQLTLHNLSYDGRLTSSSPVTSPGFCASLT